ncbi:MAG: bifunctional demethylmenaquinone methyltransferase/2-methoxy-6-polyprenyl-1,4-benzoquinol methylase UbiE [Chitinophagaceae bacterium]|nr:bifunctional demethylmenaquinone methyltransferase/2-methoxy-6-polyprenyl-1,4-benzoquinol methylase UbiE [Chitinophagaceae bacterium]
MTKFDHDSVVPYQDSALAKKDQVAEMFNRIAFRYDFMNRFLSAGIDRGWRKKALKRLSADKPKILLDVATGTGDIAIMAYELLKPERIIGIDISEKMLEIGKAKVLKCGLEQHIQLQSGDSEAINFPDDSFDAVTVAFGVRNFEHLEQGLKEIKRVLRPAGKLVILEFSKPKIAGITQLYNWYVGLVAPQMAAFVSKDKKAYQYLNKSVQGFPEGKAFVDILNNVGFRNTSCKKLSLGICSIYCGVK